MKSKMYLVVIAIIGAMAGFSLAAGAGDVALENTLLKQRLDQLDREIQALRQNASQQPAAAGSSIRMPVWSTLDIQIYGYLKLDAAYDSSLIDNGNYAKWVKSEATNDNDDQFSMTANETRLGMKIKGPNVDGMVTSGRVEVDFYGGGAENKANLMMRHAYMELGWPEKKFSILAGQTSDVISPLVPTTLNYSVCWWVGNIGYRRPQIRLTKEYSLSEDVDLKLEGAAVRTIGRDSVFVSTPTVVEDSGQDAGFPTLQGRVSVTFPFYKQRLTTIGLSGHKGEEEYDLNVAGDSKEFDTWSLNLDVSQPVCEKVLIRGELFTGEDLDAYLGGIGQGVTTTGANANTAVASSGGWIEATFGPFNKAEYNLGVAVDDVEGGDVNIGDRILNRTIFGNVIYSLNKQTDVGLELSHWCTEYRGPGDGDAVRLQAALKYKF